MAKRSSTGDTTLLALELFRRIPHHRKTTALDLHKELMAIGLQRDLRTIQRQLDMLASHFNDIERDESSRPYGYRWKPLSSGQLGTQRRPCCFAWRSCT